MASEVRDGRTKHMDDLKKRNISSFIIMGGLLIAAATIIYKNRKK